jgi:hypothetical protein
VPLSTHLALPGFRCWPLSCLAGGAGWR